MCLSSITDCCASLTSYKRSKRHCWLPASLAQIALPVQCRQHLLHPKFVSAGFSSSLPCSRFAAVNVGTQTSMSCRSLVGTQPEDREAVLTGLQARRPVAWLLLCPPRTHQRGPLQARPLSGIHCLHIYIWHALCRQLQLQCTVPLARHW